MTVTKMAKVPISVFVVNHIVAFYLLEFIIA